MHNIDEGIVIFNAKSEVLFMNNAASYMQVEQKYSLNNSFFTT